MQRIVWLLALISLAGCGGSGQVESSRETANKAFDDGIAAFESRNHQAALDHFNTAIEGGWLHPYAYAEAMTKRAVSNAALGNYDAANADIQNIGPEGDPGMILAAKAFILKKQGKAGEAQRAFQQAKRLNPSLKPFE